LVQRLGVDLQLLDLGLGLGDRHRGVRRRGRHRACEQRSAERQAREAERQPTGGTSGLAEACEHAD